MSTATITIERTLAPLQFAGQSLQVEELSVRLPFARKPADLGELGGRGATHKVYVTETKERTLPAGSTPLPAACWCHATGCVARVAALATATSASRSLLPDAPPLRQSEGGDYARYVARLG